MQTSEKLARNREVALLGVEENITLFFGLNAFRDGAKFVQKRADSTHAEHSFRFCHTVVIYLCMCILLYIYVSGNFFCK